MAPQYRLWSSSRSTWCDYEVSAERIEPAALRSLLPVGWTGESTKIERDFELSPEPLSGGRDSRIAVRADGVTVGFLAANDTAEWQGVIRRVIASGYVPVTNGNLWIYDSWEGVSARLSFKLGKPSEALPINDPPSVPYTMVPRSSIVQVTKEEEHAETLLKYVPQSGYGLAYVTLHEQAPTGASAKPRVEVRINDDRVGQLTPQMSQKYLPMIKHLADRGLVTACWGDVTGNRVAAEVRIDCRRANEADDVVLDGPPITLPRLTPQLDDPFLYDVSGMEEHLRPLTLQRPPMVAEPPDGSVVRFVKGRRYIYLAVRRGNHWETTASSPGGLINQIMLWDQLFANAHSFEIAAGWHAVADPLRSLKSAAHGTAVRFTVANLYLVGLCVRSAYEEEGSWYTTITDRAAEYLPFGSFAEWSEIARYGQHIQAVTSWIRLC